MAIKEGNLSAAQQAVTNGANVTTVIDGKTPLITAVEQVTALFTDQGLKNNLRFHANLIRKSITTRTAIPLAGNVALVASAFTSNYPILGLAELVLGCAGSYFILEAIAEKGIDERID